MQLSKPDLDRTEFTDSMSSAYEEWQRSHLESLELEAQLVATAEAAANGLAAAAPDLEATVAASKSVTQRLYAALLLLLEHRWR